MITIKMMMMVMTMSYNLLSGELRESSGLNGGVRLNHLGGAECLIIMMVVIMTVIRMIVWTIVIMLVTMLMAIV